MGNGAGGGGGRSPLHTHDRREMVWRPAGKEQGMRVNVRRLQCRRCSCGRGRCGVGDDLRARQERHQRKKGGGEGKKKERDAEQTRKNAVKRHRGHFALLSMHTAAPFPLVGDNNTTRDRDATHHNDMPLKRDDSTDGTRAANTTDTSQTRVRAWQASDYGQVDALQRKYVRSPTVALDGAVARNGFLSVALSESALATMAAEVGVVVAYVSDPDGRADGEIIGFACGSRIESVEAGAWGPVGIAMLDVLKACGTWSDDAEDATRRWWGWGPVCVDQAWRGRGVFGGMWRWLADRAAARGLDHGCLSFVAEANEVSLDAHQRGAPKMQIVGAAFTVGTRTYRALLTRTPTTRANSNTRNVP